MKIKAKTFIQRLFITFQLYNDNGLANHSAAGAYGFLLSVAPMFLIIAFFIISAFQSAPHAVATLFSNISFIDLIIDEKWLTENFLTITRPGFSSIISFLCILWAGRILALSMQRGLKVIFKGTKTRNIIKETLITLTMEIAVLLFVLILVFGSHTALFIYKIFDFIPLTSDFLFNVMNITGFMYPIIMLGFISFFAYLFSPVNPPRKLSALRGALLCAFSYGITSIFLGFLINQANYNFLYGTLGNVVFLLVNVYFFFIFFFTGAQYAFIIDFFDIILFTRLRESRNKAIENNLKGKNVKLDLINRLFYNVEGKLKKYLKIFHKGNIIFSQGDSGNDIYYLLNGEVEVSILSGETSDSNSGSAESFQTFDSSSSKLPASTSLTVYKPGIFFGEMGYFLSEPRSATTIARTDVSVLVIPPPIFEKILAFDSTLDRTLIENITQRLKSTNDKLAERRV